jgi:hypothetical protein
MPHRFDTSTPPPSEDELILIEAALRQCCPDPNAVVRKVANSTLDVLLAKLPGTPQ